MPRTPGAMLEQSEVPRLSGQFVRECREELLRQGKISKGFHVPRDELIRCVKAKWQAYKLQLLTGRR